MALATRCPNCHALFRVVADQLKLRGGLVRCGACRHVFDAIASLTYIDDNLAAAPHPTPKKGKDAPPTLHAGALAAPVLRAPTQEEVQRREAVEPPREEAGPQTLMAADAGAAGPKSAPPPAETANGAPHAQGPARATEPERRASLRRRERAATDAPARIEQPGGTAAEAVEATVEQPAFLRPEPPPRRGFSIVFGGGSAVLALLLLAQLAVVFRTELTTRWPQWRPALVQLCGVFRCQVGWPTRADLLAVVGSELQAIPGTDVLELTATIRNRANFRVALPAIEVTLTDTTNRTLARKVFAPVDYLASAGEPGSRIDDGLGAGSDYTIRVAFEARGIAAAGFIVYPFYL
jgi:predicted Zn finger-like uncharacterized protein